MTRSIVVIGAGVAGAAAAWSARREGRAVTVISAGAGASSFGGGAVDDAPWEIMTRAAKQLGEELRAGDLPTDVVEFARALDLWSLPEPGALRPRLATAAGRIRPARGHDRALLNLASLPAGARVLVPRVDRAGWDADAIAAALLDEPFARGRELRFVPADIPVLRYDDERRIPDGDLAARHDEQDRLEWLAERLRGALEAGKKRGVEVSGVLLGPWLGARSPRADALSMRAGVAVGEALAGVGSPAGLRFDAARDRLLDASGVRVVRDRALSITDVSGKLAVSVERGDAPLTSDAVVLALGGMVGGGILYTPPECFAAADLPLVTGVPFALSLRADVTLALRDAPMEMPSSLHGPELDITAWPSGERPGTLEVVGVLCRGVRAADLITAAGDVIAGRPRTILEAVASGSRAGREA